MSLDKTGAPFWESGGGVRRSRAEQCHGCGKFRKSSDLRPVPGTTSFLPGDEPQYRCTACVPRRVCCDTPDSLPHNIRCEVTDLMTALRESLGAVNVTVHCSTPDCPGDVRYAAPGRGHVEGCIYPREPEPLTAEELAARFARRRAE